MGQELGFRRTCSLNAGLLVFHTDRSPAQHRGVSNPQRETERTESPELQRFYQHADFDETRNKSCCSVTGLPDRLLHKWRGSRHTVHFLTAWNAFKNQEPLFRLTHRNASLLSWRRTNLLLLLQEDKHRVELLEMSAHASDFFGSKGLLDWSSLCKSSTWILLFVRFL